MEPFRLEALPNEDFDGEAVYLAQGRLVFSSQPGEYAMFQIGTCDCGDEHLRLKLLDETYRSLDEAVQAAKNLNFLGTIAIAHNTEGYPIPKLASTLSGMYGRRLGQTEESLGETIRVVLDEDPVPEDTSEEMGDLGRLMESIFGQLCSFRQYPEKGLED